MSSGEGQSRRLVHKYMKPAMMVARSESSDFERMQYPEPAS
jgi:hypothetical protein